MNIATVRTAALLALITAGASCGDSTGPKAGNMLVTLSGPVPARSAQFRFVGPQTAFTAGANVRVFSSQHGGDTVMVAVVAAVGHALSEGTVVTVAVPDVGAAASYTLTLLQVAASNYTLQTPSAYSLTILPQ